MLLSGLWLAAVTLLGAAALVTHLAVLVGVLRSDEASARDRGLALVPPLLPWVAWRLGRRAGPILWALLLAAYLILRLAR